MVEAVLFTEAHWRFRCPYCCAVYNRDRLHDVPYELHEDCFINDPETPVKARAAKCPDVWSYMGSLVEWNPFVLVQVHHQMAPFHKDRKGRANTWVS